MTHPYATDTYASSLAHVGTPLQVPEWGTGILVRTIRDGYQDGIGTYPITVFDPNADIAGGLEFLRRAGLVSVTLIVEDALRPPMATLESAFSFTRNFKTHYVYDREKSEPAFSKHHRYEIKRSLRSVRVGGFELAARLDEWCGLYDGLVRRHHLSGLHAFPPAHHSALAKLPGIRAIGAFLDDRLVSCHVWACHQGHAMSHLAASDEEGYALGAAYAVNEAATRELSDCKILNFGGGAGTAVSAGDGLVRFKKGFSNTTAPAYVLGAVLNQAVYASLVNQMAAGTPDEQFFPSYRRPAPRKVAS